MVGCGRAFCPSVGWCLLSPKVSSLCLCAIPWACDGRTAGLHLCMRRWNGAFRAKARERGSPPNPVYPAWSSRRWKGEASLQPSHHPTSPQPRQTNHTPPPYLASLFLPVCTALTSGDILPNTVQPPNIPSGSVRSLARKVATPPLTLALPPHTSHPLELDSFPACS